MGKLEDVEAEKKVWESDDAWELRKAFMLAHYDDYPKIQLQCLSQLFINVTLLGCEYSESLMQKIREMGAGISASKDRTKSGNYVKASTAKKRQAVKPSDLEGATAAKRQSVEKSPEPIVEEFNNRLEKLKASLAMTPHHLTGEQMMKAAINSCLMKWHVKKVNQKIEISIDRYVVLRHTFSQYCVDANECAINALIESILSCEAAVNDDGDEIRFDSEPADNCYAKSVERRLAKIKGAVMNGAHTLKGLSTCLESVNMSLIQNAKKLEDEMSSDMCQRILKDKLQIVNSLKSHSSLIFQ
uniref:XRN2-binding (XTBD) domain-containing protein n=1 Tax=Caenorhabditis tropicalis TaxID=1561998 RepID=A0A1I7UXY6_9PELO